LRRADRAALQPYTNCDFRHTYTAREVRIQNVRKEFMLR
jgi:hypothetical protein